MDDHLNEFMNDPAKIVALYLGSYMRRQGLHLTEKNLHRAPLLLKFFIRFLRKHNVFVGEDDLNDSVLPNIDLDVPLPRFLQSHPLLSSKSGQLNIAANLELALSIIDLAIEELPLVSQAAKALSCEAFGALCKDIFSVGEHDTLPVASEEGHNGEHSRSLTPPCVIDDASTDALDPAAWKIIPPSVPQDIADTDSDSQSQPDLDQSDSALFGKLTKVVLDPWLGWETEIEEPDLFEPRVLRSPVYPNETTTVAPKATHNPACDAITLLLEPCSAYALRVGMGVGGIWNQMAPASVSNGELGPTATAKSEDGVFWYLTDVKVVVPSYYFTER
ncbi:hypothetical protein BDP27DRAFT_1331811 [Rhodocollybia butyracea]|uniref:Uncharacterized protein n=1 Tax=Rhodocollybia butyracea TaxID=206335 RepID=A0A9P5PHS5_9AGAR|nr:hypothetical protein BDP27DRAFT_1331811 [Rhodocollybia butyracea]